MKVTQEMMAKFELCKSAEEIMEIAKQENMSITMEQAKEIFYSENLSEEEMEKLQVVIG